MRKFFFIVLYVHIFSFFPLFSQEARAFKLAVIPDKPVPGEPISVALAEMDAKNLKLVLANEQGVLAQAPFFIIPQDAGSTEKTVYAALLAVPSTAKPGAAVLYLQKKGKTEDNAALIKGANIVIGERKFASETIPLDSRNTAIRTEPSKKKTEQAEKLWSIISHTGNDFYTNSSFMPPVPVNTRRTSFFGDRRVYKYSNNKSDTSIHAGIDYGVPVGTPVMACADGKVILAEFRETTGNSVVIEHLPGVYSLYYHLSAISVQEGSLIKRSAILGQSGATGLATGPHLHWEIRVAAENTDPDICIIRPIFDKKALLAKLKE